MKFAIFLLSLCFSTDNNANEMSLKQNLLSEAAVDLKENNEQPVCLICYEKETNENKFRLTKCERPHGPYCTYCLAKVFKAKNKMNCPECRATFEWNDVFPNNEPRPLCLICYENETVENHFLFTNCDQLHGPYCNQCVEKRFLESWRSYINCPKCQIPVYSKDVFSKQQIERLQSTRRNEKVKQVLRGSLALMKGSLVLMKKMIFDPKYLQYETALIYLFLWWFDKNHVRGTGMLEVQYFLEIFMVLMWVVALCRRNSLIGQWFQALPNPYKLVYRAVAIIAAIALIILRTSNVGEGESYFE